MKKKDAEKGKYLIEMESYLKELLMIMIVIALSLIPIGINKYIFNKTINYEYGGLLSIILFVIVAFLAHTWSNRGDCKAVFTIIIGFIAICVGSYIMNASGCGIYGTAKCTSDEYLTNSIGINIIIYMTIYIIVYILHSIEKKIMKEQT